MNLAHIIKNEEQSWKYEEDPVNQSIDADLAKYGTTFKAAIAALDIKRDDLDWFFDTGASRHVSRQKIYFDSLEHGIKGNVKTAGGQSHSVVGGGVVNFQFANGLIKKIEIYASLESKRTRFP